ncbi:hypothetical protein FE773_07980 [Caminibacter mediatlanticus TB-2]|uniref:Lipoprotein n=1 Tax=Caminibacter mediatlanticus TB-2 TaxID=391592 RepID=A0ABX5VBW2_9BACT|nr:hypothetical protein [Caminibacter mediatlanticus]QCT95129.1 hypothetical protein FE773_07980 [Caminibacter mediatlanticus TB-2]
MKFIFLIIPLFFIGCVTKQGISYKYYPECEENYGLYGTYYYDCKDMLIKFKKNKKKICLECN